jgi:hypothetical protein
MPTMNLTNLLVSPTLLILIAASAALLVSIGVLLVWPAESSEIVRSGRRNRKA